MPKPIKQEKRPKDINQLARHLVELSTSEVETIPVMSTGLSEYMAAIGRKGGKIGGKRRLQTMSPEKRKRIAKRAAAARWKSKS